MTVQGTKIIIVIFIQINSRSNQEKYSDKMNLFVIGLYTTGIVPIFLRSAYVIVYSN